MLSCLFGNRGDFGTGTARKPTTLSLVAQPLGAQLVAQLEHPWWEVLLGLELEVPHLFSPTPTTVEMFEWRRPTTLRTRTDRRGPPLRRLAQQLSLALAERGTGLVLLEERTKLAREPLDRPSLRLALPCGDSGRQAEDLSQEPGMPMEPAVLLPIPCSRLAKEPLQHSPGRDLIPHTEPEDLTVRRYTSAKRFHLHEKFLTSLNLQHDDDGHVVAGARAMMKYRRTKADGTPISGSGAPQAQIASPAAYQAGGAARSGWGGSSNGSGGGGVPKISNDKNASNAMFKNSSTPALVNDHRAIASIFPWFHFIYCCIRIGH